MHLSWFCWIFHGTSWRGGGFDMFFACAKTGRNIPKVSSSWSLVVTSSPTFKGNRTVFLRTAKHVNWPEMAAFESHVRDKLEKKHLWPEVVDWDISSHPPTIQPHTFFFTTSPGDSAPCDPGVKRKAPTKETRPTTLLKKPGSPPRLFSELKKPFGQQGEKSSSTKTKSCCSCRSHFG